MDNSKSPPMDSDIDLTEDHISPMVRHYKEVHFNEPYVRLEKLTSKQIQSKIKSKSTASPDLSSVGTNKKSISSPCKPNRSISVLEDIDMALPKKGEKIINNANNLLTTEQKIKTEIVNTSSSDLIYFVPPRPSLPISNDVGLAAHELEDGDFIEASLINSSDGTIQLQLESIRAAPGLLGYIAPTNVTSTAMSTSVVGALPYLTNISSDYTDTSCLIYPARNIFEKQDTRTVTKCILGHEDNQNRDRAIQSTTTAKIIIGIKDGKSTSQNLSHTNTRKRSFKSAFTYKNPSASHNIERRIQSMKLHRIHKGMMAKGKSSQGCHRKVSGLLKIVKPTQGVVGENTIGNIVTANENDDNDNEIQIIDAVQSIPVQKRKQRHEMLGPRNIINGNGKQADTTSVIDWLNLQKNRKFPSGASNVILLDPDPFSAVSVNSYEISTESPVTCKLCQTKLGTKLPLKNHVENCWFHNKDRHIFCIICETLFKTPMQRKSHEKRKHSRTETEGNKGLEEADTTENVVENDLDLDILQLGEWILKRKKMFPDVILVHPDPTSDSYINSATSVKQTATTELMCRLCRFDCTPEKLMKCHVQICWPYNKKNHCYCVVCGIDFISARNLRRHQRLSDKCRRSSPTSLSCKDCHQEFKSIPDLSHHVDSAQEFFRNMKQVQANINRQGSMYAFISFTSASAPLLYFAPQVSNSAPATCRLCRTKLKTEPDVKHHAENCWHHNKDRHTFCITCEMYFKTPVQLNQHYERKHSDTKTATENKGTQEAGALTQVDNMDTRPLDEWIRARKQIFPDIILVHPDFSSSDSHPNFVESIQHTTTSAPFWCKLCTFQCVTEEKIKRHVQICWTYNKRNHVYCVPCRRAFKSAAALENHQRVTMFHSFKPQPLPSVFCRDCHQQFPSKSCPNFQRHVDSAQTFFSKMKQIQDKMSRQF